MRASREDGGVHHPSTAELANCQQGSRVLTGAVKQPLPFATASAAVPQRSGNQQAATAADTERIHGATSKESESPPVRGALDVHHHSASSPAPEEGNTAADQQKQQQSVRNNVKPPSETKRTTTGRSRMAPAQVETYIDVLKEHGFNLDKLCEKLPELPREKLAQFWKNHKRVRERKKRARWVLHDGKRSSQIDRACAAA